MVISKKKMTFYIFLVVLVFVLGLLESVFSVNERTDHEYGFIKGYIKSSYYRRNAYGGIIGFTNRPSAKQYPDSSIYNFAVEYTDTTVYIQCKLLHTKDNKTEVSYIKEYKSNFQVLKQKMFSK